MESEGLSGVGGDVLDVLVAVIVDASDRIPEDKASGISARNKPYRPHK